MCFTNTVLYRKWCFSDVDTNPSWDFDRAPKTDSGSSECDALTFLAVPAQSPGPRPTIIKIRNSIQSHWTSNLMAEFINSEHVNQNVWTNDLASDRIVDSLISIGRPTVYLRPHHVHHVPGPTMFPAQEGTRNEQNTTGIYIHIYIYTYMLSLARRYAHSLSARFLVLFTYNLNSDTLPTRSTKQA